MAMIITYGRRLVQDPPRLQSTFGRIRRENSKAIHDLFRRIETAVPSRVAEVCLILTFTKAVCEYCKEAVKEGSFSGGYRMSLKDQMEGRMGKIWNEGSKVRAIVVGGGGGVRWEDWVRRLE
jgi:hypothetical protein